MGTKRVKDITNVRRRRPGKGGKALPVSVNKMKLLGFECQSITEADCKIDLGKSLADLISLHDELAEAWRRGQFLRELQKLATSVVTMGEAASWLRRAGYGEFCDGKALAAAIDGDREYKNLWHQSRLEKRIETRRGIIDAAIAGNQWAIRWADVFLKEGSDDDKAPQDWHIVTVAQLMQLTGKSRQAIYEWRKDGGMPSLGSEKFVRVDLLRFVPWYFDYATRQARGGKALISANPLQQAKARALDLEFKEQLGEMVSDREFVATLAACMQRVIAVFANMQDLVGLVHGQEPGQIARAMEDLRDQVIGHLQTIPDCLHFDGPTKEALIAFHRALVQCRASQVAATG